MKARERDLLTIGEAASALGVDEARILTLGFEDQLSIGTVTPTGQTLFLVSKALHHFVADPSTTIRLGDLGLVYEGPVHSSAGFMPSPGTPRKPNASVTIGTLRVPRAEVLLLKSRLPWPTKLQLALRRVAWLKGVVSVGTKVATKTIKP